MDDARARRLAHELGCAAYYETRATYGFNVDLVFTDGTSTSTSTSAFTFGLSFNYLLLLIRVALTTTTSLRVHQSSSFSFCCCCSTCSAPALGSLPKRNIRRARDTRRHTLLVLLLHEHQLRFAESRVNTLVPPPYVHVEIELRLNQ